MMQRGSDRPAAKLTEDFVRLIRSALASPAPPTMADLGRSYGVLIVTIYRIKTGENWKHVA